MQKDIIIIGQGIAGTLLGYYLGQAGISFIIIDEPKPNTASKSAAGIINPVTGRRIVRTWKIEELMAFAKKCYREIEQDLNMQCMTETKIIDFFPTPQMRNSFLKRFEEDVGYLRLPGDENDLGAHFHYDFGYGEIAPALLVNMHELLAAFRTKWIAEQKLEEAHFNMDELMVSENEIHYGNIIAGKIIFTDGIESYSNPYFKSLPFAPNKGEALIAEINEFPSGCIFKKGISIVPWKENLFWVGSSYQWEFDHDQPTAGFREQTVSTLRSWIKNDFTIAGHVAAIRPATIERRPFVGFHPLYKNVGILNGMGTKGCSLAPFFARQLVGHLVAKTPLDAEADIRRFDRMLSRK